MSDRSEEDIIARTPTMRGQLMNSMGQPHKSRYSAREWEIWLLGGEHAMNFAAERLEARADGIEAESASIFAGAIVSELRSQANKLRDMYVKEGE